MRCNEQDKLPDGPSARDEATIEDLAFTNRSLRESDAKKAEDGDVVLSTTLLWY
jgi:hypothetical protein